MSLARWCIGIFNNNNNTHNVIPQVGSGTVGCMEFQQQNNSIPSIIPHTGSTDSGVYGISTTNNNISWVIPQVASLEVGCTEFQQQHIKCNPRNEFWRWWAVWNFNHILNIISQMRSQDGELYGISTTNNNIPSIIPQLRSS